MASDDEGHTNGAPAPSDLSEILEFSVNTKSSGRTRLGKPDLGNLAELSFLLEA